MVRITWYVYDGESMIGHSTYGLKLRMMRKNPAVCVEVDRMENLANWRSVIAWGRFEELTGADASAALITLRQRLRPLMVSETSQPSHGLRGGRDGNPPRERPRRALPHPLARKNRTIRTKLTRNLELSRRPLSSLPSPAGRASACGAGHGASPTAVPVSRADRSPRPSTSSRSETVTIPTNRPRSAMGRQPIVRPRIRFAACRTVCVGDPVTAWRVIRSATVRPARTAAPARLPASRSDNTPTTFDSVRHDQVSNAAATHQLPRIRGGRRRGHGSHARSSLHRVS